MKPGTVGHQFLNTTPYHYTKKDIRMHKRSVLARVVSAMLLALTACHDLPTPVAPEMPAPGASASLNQGQHLGQVPFYCTVTEYAPSAPNGWETRRMTVLIPRGELHDAGRTVRYARTRRLSPTVGSSDP